MEPFGVVEANVDQLGEALRCGRITSVELVAAFLNRIAAYDRRGPRLNSMPILNPACFEDAARCDQEHRNRLEVQAALPSLHGIPFTVKDSFKVAGLTVAAGSPAFAELTAQEDAFVVSALRSQGAIVLGKTNMPPMAIGGCQRGLYGRAESPYNPDFLPAAWHSGSSSGSGVAVSANMCVFGIGEETVSSGRSPASNGGLVAYTPSRGLISTRGNWPLFVLRDTVVPHTRTMRDMFHVVDALMIDDLRPKGDLWKSQEFVHLSPLASVRPESFLSLASPGGLKGRRLGIPKMYIGHDPDATEPILVRASIKKLMEAAKSILTRLGAECVDVDLPVVSAYEKDRPNTQSLVERGLLYEGWNQIEINDLVSAGWEEFLKDNGDKRLSSLAMVKPWTIHADPPDAVDTRRSGVAHEGQDQILYEYIVKRVQQRTQPECVLDFAQLPKVCTGLEQARKELFEHWLTNGGLDGIVFPANADVAPSNADTEPSSSEIAWRNGTVFSNMNHVMRHLGIPSVSVTMGVMEDTGMPVGLTFAGPAYSDVELMRWAYDYGTASSLREAPSSTPELKATLSPGIDAPQLNGVNRSPVLSLGTQLAGSGKIDVNGHVHLTVEATVSMGTGEPLPQSEPKCRLDVSLVVDGIHRFQFENSNGCHQESFKTTLDISAVERRGARCQSSLLVAIAITSRRDQDGGVQKLVTAGSFLEIPYRHA